MIFNESSSPLDSTLLYDTFDPDIKEKVSDPTTFRKILKVSQDFFSKNEHALSTNIVGRRVLVNEKMENDIYDAFGTPKSRIKEIMVNSPYWKQTFGRELQLTDQLCLSVPLILGALEYYRIGKKEESELCWLLLHFKPYSSRESLFFKFGVKEGQMLYTVENSLSERFDIKKYGTIINSLRKRASSSYANYISSMKQSDKISDKRMYVAYTSGISGSVNTFIGGIVKEYRKNEGKSLNFEDAASSVYDKDEDATEYQDNDIASDIAIKNNIVNKTLVKLAKDPIDKKLVRTSVRAGFSSDSMQYDEILTNVINETIDKMFDDLQPFFSALIGSFLFHKDSTGKKNYSMTEFRSPVFLTVGIDILAGKKSNVKDQNLLECRKIFKKMLNEHSIAYLNFGDTYRRKLEKSLAVYWITFIRKANS